MQIRLMTDKDMDSLIDIWLAASKRPTISFHPNTGNQAKGHAKRVFANGRYLYPRGSGHHGRLYIDRSACLGRFVRSPSRSGQRLWRALLQFVKDRSPKLELKGI